MAVLFRRVRIDIHDNVIARMNMDGGQVWRFVKKVTDDAAEEARIAAPVRTMFLMESIEAGRPVYNPRWGCSARVRAHAPYAKAVNDGTLDALIVPKYHEWMRLPPWGKWPLIFRKQVSGQRPQKFLEAGLGASMARHGLH